MTIDIATTFHGKPNRTLVAEIPGVASGTRCSWCCTGAGQPRHAAEQSGTHRARRARAGAGRQRQRQRRGDASCRGPRHDEAIASGAIPPPKRTITFLWLDEIRGSEQWLKEDPARAARVVAMMSLDMTGEDTAKTGGTFLIEKMPDPSAIYARPSDPHSEWGAGEVDRAWVKGHFLNDLHLAVALRRARDTGWIVRTNPYEGGSDHTVFTRAGVPALLNWHFTDRYYHTNLDTLDKTSAQTMGHVATAVATTAMFLASVDAVGCAGVGGAHGRGRTGAAGDRAGEPRQRRHPDGLAHVVHPGQAERHNAGSMRRPRSLRRSLESVNAFSSQRSASSVFAGSRMLIAESAGFLDSSVRAQRGNDERSAGAVEREHLTGSDADGACCRQQLKVRSFEALASCTPERAD